MPSSQPKPATTACLLILNGNQNKGAHKIKNFNFNFEEIRLFGMIWYSNS